MPRPVPQTRFDETGSALIEAIVSAAILLLAIVSLFVALDGQTKASDISRSSSVAGSLAEADQERLRSFRVPDLSNRHEVRNVVLAGQSFTVESRVDWIRDATGGTTSCASSSSQADYLRLTSTVTGKASGGPVGGKPLKIRSLVAPPVGQFGPGQGTLAIKTSDAQGKPVTGVTTSITGPTSLSDSSNEVGCAVFGYVPVGAYTVQLSAPGYVDPSGNSVASGSATATEGTTNLTELQYDRAATVTTTFETKVGSAAAQPAKALVVSAANANIPSSGYQRFPRAGGPAPTPQTTIDASGLYPFPSAYALYAGSCPAANPALYNASYYSSYPGNIVVGAGMSYAVKLREPALQLGVKAAAASTPVTVTARSTDATCTDVFTWTMSAGTVSTPLPDPGMPFGRYNICVAGASRIKQFSNVDLTNPAGSAPLTVDLTSGSDTSGGSCP